MEESQERADIAESQVNKLRAKSREIGKVSETQNSGSNTLQHFVENLREKQHNWKYCYNIIILLTVQ